MNTIVEDNTWKQVCKDGHKLTRGPLWKKLNWKVNIRFFKTPFIISKFDKTKTNLCWRGCGQIGDHTHIFWDCPKLKVYWEGIWEELSNILQIYIIRDLLIFIFGVLPPNILTEKKKSVF